jgi:hypothetical protein
VLASHLGVSDFTGGYCISRLLQRAFEWRNQISLYKLRVEASIIGQRAVDFQINERR